MIHLKTVACGVLLMLACTSAAAEYADQVQKPVDEAIQIRQKTQQDADQWAETQAKLQAEYEQLERMRDQLAAQNEEWEKRTAARQAAVDQLEQEIASIARISEELLPFLEQVYARLADLVQTDAPFLADERQRRIANLRRIMDDHQTASGEKFRKIFEALAIEAEYGTTVEMYPQKITLDDQAVMVNIFRLGRIALFFQTPDGETCGVFDSASRQWSPLPPRYNAAITAAMEIGAKRRPVELLNLPIGRIAAP